MAPVPRFEFDRLLRALDPDAFEAFVADLWEARGWTVERSAGRLVVAHPTFGDRRTLAVRAVPWWRPGTPSSATASADVDAVVVNRPVPGDGGSVVGSAELYEMARYSLDPETRAELFRSHVHRTGSLSGWAIRRVPPGAPRRYASVAVALAVLLAAAATGAVFLPGDSAAPGLGDASGSVPSVDAGADRETPSEFAATQWPGTAGGYPPGLESDGITDSEALASTHADRVARRSSQLTMTVLEFEDGRRVGSYRERIAVHDRWTFVSSIDRSGDLRGEHPTIAAVEMYSDGKGAYLHAPAARTVGRQEILLASPGDVTGIHHRVELFLSDVLSVNESSVVETRQIGDTTLHRVNGTDRQSGGVTENVSVLVSAGGTVHSVHTERDVPGTNRSTVLTLRYAYGPVTVEPPPWVGNQSVTIGRGFPTSKR